MFICHVISTHVHSTDHDIGGSLMLGVVCPTGH